MSYLLETSREAFFNTPRLFLNPGAMPKPAIISITLHNLLTRFKAEYQQSKGHLSFSQFFQEEMQIKDRGTAKVALHTFFGQIIPCHPGQEVFPGFNGAMEKDTPVLLKQMLSGVAFSIARVYYPHDILFSFVKNDIPVRKGQGQFAKLLHTFQNNVLKSPEINEFLMRLFLLYQIPQSVIDYEVTALSAFMRDLFCDLNKRNLILRSMRDWPTCPSSEKISFLQQFTEWHSAAFGISVPKVMGAETDVSGYMRTSHRIAVTASDLDDKHFVELMLYCLHENMYNYHMHLYRDFDLDSKQDPALTSNFYKELSGVKDARQYVKTLYLSFLNCQSSDDGLDFYYLQPLKFHAFTHEFLFATVFLEDFSKVDLSGTLFLYQKVGELFYRQGEGYLDQIQFLIDCYRQQTIYSWCRLDVIAQKVMPRYLTFLEVYFAHKESNPSLLKAIDELRRYGVAYEQSLLEAGVIRALAL